MTLFATSRGVATLFTIALLTTCLEAQSLRVTPGAGLQVGDNATITYSDASRAGQTIVVTVSGGFPVTTTHEVFIVLGADGKGTGTWTVVGGWRGAAFNAPGAAQVSVMIS